jgi:hypothetical protein
MTLCVGTRVTCGNRKIDLCFSPVDDKLRLRLVYSAKIRRRAKRSTGLDVTGALVRSLIRSGATFNFHQEAVRNRDELRLRDTDVRNILCSGKPDRQEATAAYEPEQFVFVGCVEEQQKNRRIQREFAITISVERPQKPGLLGVLRIRQVRERGV